MTRMQQSTDEHLRLELSNIAARAWRTAQRTGCCEVRMCINQTPGSRRWSVIGPRSRLCEQPGDKWQFVGTYNREATELMILADLEAMNPEPR